MKTKQELFINDFLNHDKSYKERFSPIQFLFTNKHKKDKLRREGYEVGFHIGFEQSINFNDANRQLIQLHKGINNKNQQEFYDKFLEICELYNIRITYHPKYGMIWEQLYKN